jgi:outer membrane protein assembly factor BamB
MSWSVRRVLVVLTATAAFGAAACLQTAFAQKEAPGAAPPPPQAAIGKIIINPQPQPGTGSADAASFDLPKDTTARRRIEAARDYIQAKRWEEVARALQDILDDPQDKFAPLPRKGADGKEVEVPTSVRAEANRLLAALPKEGLEVYKSYGEAGPKAAEYLKKAKDATTSEDRLLNLGLVVRNYLHTDAGGEAADLLATHYMDRGDFRTAARFYSLLLTRAGGMDDLPADVIFRAAYAFNQTGDKGEEDLLWQAARARGIREIKLGDEAKSVSDLQDYLAGIVPLADAVGRQWAYFLGDAAHTGKGDGGPAFMFRKWFSPTNVASSEAHADFGVRLKELFNKASDKLAQVNQPVLPSQFPVTTTVTLKRDGKKHSLVVFRDHAGIEARDMVGGRLEGLSPINGSWDWMMKDPSRSNAMTQWTQAYLGDNGQVPQRPGIIFENTTIGTLSTDGDLAYTVEDLVIPPPAQFRMNMGFPGNPNPWGWPPDLVAMVEHSRLMAYDLSAGCKVAWEAPPPGDTKSEFADSYFLGPPLAVNGKLYVLSEKQEELRLLCLENVKDDRGGVKPKIDFVLPLGTSHDKLQMDVLRRVNAAHLAYGEGVLVCPTNLGYVIGIDLLQNSLLWAYPYRDKADAEDNTNPNMGVGGKWGGIRPGLPPGMVQTPPQQGWRASAPIIQDGKVVFTAPDSRSVHCINLKDGAPAWSRPRQEGDLFLGGVVDGRAIIVGAKVVHAYDLAKGDEAWKVETGMPSGFGAASENVYYVPLKEAVATKEPEICAIDVAKGAVVGHSKARAQDANDPKSVDVPGNLVFFDGGIISQNNDDVIVYPQVKTKIAEMSELLKANPNDIQGLFDRGELSLEEGNLDAAVQDFLHVLHNGPPDSLLKKAKDKLYYALTEDFQHNFDQAEKYTDDYNALCSLDLPATASDQDKAEARRRRTNYLYLTAKGKEGQRKLTEAFDLYLKLNAEAQPDELLSLVDEKLVKAAPDVLAQGRIAAMVAGASEAERKPLEAGIAARWKEIQHTNDLAELHRFVTLFGSLFAVGDEARLDLAERLMGDDKDPDALNKDPNALIDAERQLSLLRARTQDPQAAARAVECMARLETRKGLLDDAAYYYRLLRDRYADVKVRDGKTGADFFNEAAGDKRFWASLDDAPRAAAAGRLHAEEERGNFNPAQQRYKFAHEGEPLPFYQRYTLALEFGSNTLRLIDRTDPEAAEPRWKPLPVAQNGFQTIATWNNQFNQLGGPIFVGPGMQQPNPQPPPSPKFAFSTIGHLAVLPVGHMVYGVDVASGRLLWSKNLFDPVNGRAAPTLQPNNGMPGPSVTVDPRDGSAQIVYQDGWTQRLGQTGPLEGAAVCLQMKDSLTAVDPISGRVLWTRSDVSPRSSLFGDDQHVFVVEMSPDGKPAYTRVFRTYDGATVHAPDFTHAYEDRIRMVGRNILVADKDKEATTLRLYDPLTGQDVWKQAFAAHANVLQGDEGNLAGVIEPDGLVRVVDVATRKEVLNANSKIDPKYMEKDATYAILGDATDVYIAPNAPLAPNTRENSNLMPGTGLRGLNVNGELFAFKRETGKRHWQFAAANTQLVLDQFQEMPMVLLTGQSMKFQNPFGGPITQPVTSLAVIDKRTGKLALTYGAGEQPPRDNFTGGPFHSLDLDAKKGVIEFTSPQSRVNITMESEKPAAPAAP